MILNFTNTDDLATTSGDNVVHKPEQVVMATDMTAVSGTVWTLGAPLGIVWLSRGRGLEAVDTQPRSNVGPGTLLLVSLF